MTKFTTPKDLAFLKFFNELPSPIKEWAIENYDAEFVKCTPKEFDDAIVDGFDWEEAPQKSDYWISVFDMVYHNQPITNPVHLLPEGYKFEEVKVPSAEFDGIKLREYYKKFQKDFKGMSVGTAEDFLKYLLNQTKTTQP